MKQNIFIIKVLGISHPLLFLQKQTMHIFLEIDHYAIMKLSIMSPTETWSSVENVTVI